MDSITLEKVLEAFDKGEHFSIAFVTADHHKKKGGEWIFIERAWKHTHAPKPKRSVETQPVSSVKKNPNHFENSTRNIRLPNGEIRKVHIRLIRRFCGKTVI